MDEWLRVMVLDDRNGFFCPFFEVSLAIFLLYLFVVFEGSLEDLFYLFGGQMLWCRFLLFGRHQVSYFEKELFWAFLLAERLL